MNEKMIQLSNNALMNVINQYASECARLKVQVEALLEENARLEKQAEEKEGEK